MIHVLLLQNRHLFGPEVQVTAEELVNLDLGRLQDNEVISLCHRRSSTASNMFHHLPSEGNGIDFHDHSKCSCNQADAISKVLLHSHNLVYDERLFRVFLDKCRERDIPFKLVITTMPYPDAVLSIERNNKDKDRSWIGRSLSLSGVAISCSLAELRILTLKKKADVFLLDIDDFNERHEAKQLELYRWMNIDEKVIRPETLAIRGVSWTGGYQPPFGSKVRADAGSPFTRALLNLTRPSSKFGLRGITLLVTQTPLHVLALATLFTSRLLPSIVRADDLEAAKHFILGQISLCLWLIKAPCNFLR